MSLQGRLVPSGRVRLIKFMKWVGRWLLASVFLVTAMIMMGGDAMIGSLAIQAFVSVCGTVGNRVWGSTPLHRALGADVLGVPSPV
jgi:hypothetical protein